MPLPRLLLLLTLVAVAAGCQTHFTKLRVTNVRGEFISEWIAKGPVHKIEQGYRITALERISAPPYATVTRYPEGWRTTVAGPHILRWRCGEPFWLYRVENRAEEK